MFLSKTSWFSWSKLVVEIKPNIFLNQKKTVRDILEVDITLINALATLGKQA